VCVFFLILFFLIFFQKKSRGCFSRHAAARNSREIEKNGTELKKMRNQPFNVVHPV